MNKKPNVLQFNDISENEDSINNNEKINKTENRMEEQKCQKHYSFLPV